MRISSITKNAGKACNNRLYRHIRTFEKIVKNYFVIYIEKDFVYRNRRHNRFEEDGKWFDSADYAGGVIVLYSGGGRPL